MTLIGLHLSCEEHPPGLLVDAAARAEAAGFDFLGVSDHFHPWTRAQGSSPFVWSVLGAISQVTERVEVGTAVTCPTIRTHPAVIAQASATTAAMLDGRFFFGIGTGERLNESITGARWPATAVRRSMLEEAVEIIRSLWSGEMVRAFRGRYYTVERARLFTLPDSPPPMVVSGLGRQSAALAGRIGDGYMNLTPDSDRLGAFHAAGGRGKPAYGKLNVCWAESEQEARRLAHELWPTSALPGELNQELATPEHYEHAARLVTEDEAAKRAICSPNPEHFVQGIRAFADAGYTHVLIHQYGPRQPEFIDLFAREIRPRL